MYLIPIMMWTYHTLVDWVNNTNINKSLKRISILLSPSILLSISNSSYSSGCSSLWHALRASSFRLQSTLWCLRLRAVRSPWIRDDSSSQRPDSWGVTQSVCQGPEAHQEVREVKEWVLRAKNVTTRSTVLLEPRLACSSFIFPSFEEAFLFIVLS